MQHPPGDAAHHPAWQPIRPTRSHGDQEASPEDACPLHILPTLRHPDDAGSDICIDGDRPGDGKLKVRDIPGDLPFTDLFHGGTEVLFRLVYDGFSFTATDLVWIRSDHDPREMERTSRGSRQGGTQLGSESNRRQRSR